MRTSTSRVVLPTSIAKNGSRRRIHSASLSPICLTISMVRRAWLMSVLSWSLSQTSMHLICLDPPLLKSLKLRWLRRTYPIWSLLQLCHATKQATGLASHKRSWQELCPWSHSSGRSHIWLEITWLTSTSSSSSSATSWTGSPKVNSSSSSPSYRNTLTVSRMSPDWKSSTLTMKSASRGLTTTKSLS